MFDLSTGVISSTSYINQITENRKSIAAEYQLNTKAIPAAAIRSAFLFSFTSWCTPNKINGSIYTPSSHIILLACAILYCIMPYPRDNAITTAISRFLKRFLKKILQVIEAIDNFKITITVKNACS